MAIISPFGSCISPGQTLRIESLSHLANPPSTTPNHGIEDWFWTVRNPSGAITANNGPAMFFRPNLAGSHEVRLIIWDLYGWVAGTSASFQVENRTLIDIPLAGGMSGGLVE